MDPTPQDLMPIRYEGTFTSEDLLWVDRAIRKALGQSSPYANVGCFVVGALIGLPLAVAALFRGDESAAVQWFVLGGAAAAVAVWHFLALRRSTARNPSIGQSISGHFDEQGFEIHTLTSESRIAWADLSFTQATDDVLLLGGRGQELFAFSRGFFASPEDFASAVALARRQAPATLPVRPRGRRLLTLFVWVVIFVAIIVLWALYREGG